MESTERAVKLVKNVVVIVFLALVVIYTHQKELEGTDLRLVVVEHKTLIEKLREKLDRIQKDEDSKHESLLERLRNLEKRHGDLPK